MHNKKILAIMTLALSGCVGVDATEHCFETRYGKLVDEQMDQGLNWLGWNDATCFTMTEKNYPEGTVKAEDGNTYQKGELIEAQTKDPITVQGDLAIIYRYDPATIRQTFLDKRTPEATEAEIVNAVREGYRNALAKWSIAEIFTNRASLADSVRVQIQRKLTYVTKNGQTYERAEIVNAFVRDIKVPKQIEQARIDAAQQAQILDKALKQLTIDSVNARRTVMTASAQAESKRLEAQSYQANPLLMQLEIAKQQAVGLANVCKNSSTCILGGSVIDAGFLKR